MIPEIYFLNITVEEDNVSSRRLLQDMEYIAMLDQCYQIVESARKEGSDLPLVKVLSREVFDNVKLRITKNDRNFLDVIWPGVRALQREYVDDVADEIQDEIECGSDFHVGFEDLIIPLVKNMHHMGGKIPLEQAGAVFRISRWEVSGNDPELENGGIIAPDVESYRVFEEVMIPVVRDIQGIQAIHPQPETFFFPDDETEMEVRKDGIIDRTKRRVNKLIRHFKNEVVPVQEEVLPAYEDTIKSGFFTDIKGKMQQMMYGLDYERNETVPGHGPAWNKTNVNIMIVNPDEETMEVVIEEFSGAERLRDVVPWKLEAENVDPTSKYVISATIECSRNLDKYQFPAVLGEEDLDFIELKLRSALKYQTVIGAEKVSGGVVKGAATKMEEDQYFSVEDILSKNKVTTQLAARELLISLSGDVGSDRCRLLHGNHWPHYRGVHLSSDGNLAAWINVQEHLRIIACTASESPGSVGEAYARLARLMSSLDRHLKPRRSDTLGFITSRPCCLGNTLRFQVVVRLPRLAREGRLLADFIRVQGLVFTQSDESNVVFRIRNRQCLGLTEYESYLGFVTAIGQLIQLEKGLSQEKSKHVSELIRNILGGKKVGEKEVRLEQKVL